MLRGKQDRETQQSFKQTSMLHTHIKELRKSVINANQVQSQYFTFILGTTQPSRFFPIGSAFTYKRDPIFH
jgi:hypothetical protein